MYSAPKLGQGWAGLRSPNSEQKAYTHTYVLNRQLGKSLIYGVGIFFFLFFFICIKHTHTHTQANQQTTLLFACSSFGLCQLAGWLAFNSFIHFPFLGKKVGLSLLRQARPKTKVASSSAPFELVHLSSCSSSASSQRSC